MLQIGASSKEKANLPRWLTVFKNPMAIHPRSEERGILAFSRNAFEVRVTFSAHESSGKPFCLPLAGCQVE